MSRQKIIGLGLIVYLGVVVGLTVFSLKSEQLLSSDAQVIDDISPVIRGLAGDLWADVVIGKRDFGEISPREVVSHKVHAPGGVVLDSSSSNEKLYIWDSGNNRILGIDLGKCRDQSDPCEATIVIGQPSLNDYGSCNQDASFQYYPYRSPARADSLCSTAEHTPTTLEDKSLVSLAVDSQGSLFVPDVHNHRVLKYLDPFGTDQVADAFWGQPDLKSNICNRGTSPSANNLCFDSPGGAAVAMDNDGNMWVADGKNNRILRFSKIDNNIVDQADLVLGQASFTSQNPGNGMSQLSRPSGLAFDAQGRLFVADSGNNRVLIFQRPFSTGMEAQLVYLNNLDYVTSVTTDPSNRGMWVFDHSPEGLKLYDLDGNLQEKISSGRGGGSIGIDGNNTVYAAWYAGVSEVVAFTIQSSPRDRCELHDGNLSGCNANPGCAYYFCSSQCWLNGTPNTIACFENDYAPVQNFFKPTNAYNQISASRLEHSAWQGLTVTDSQLVVADSRLLYWNNPSYLINGQPADGFVNAANFLTIPDPQYSQLDSDASNRIWASRKDRIEMFESPLTAGKAPSLTVGPTIPVIDTLLTINLVDVQGVAITPDAQFLWISEPGNHRVVRVINPLTNPMVDIILGQDHIANNTYPDDGFNPSTGDADHPNLCNRGAYPLAPARPLGVEPDLDMLCFPGAIALDKLGNLYVSDHMIETTGNWRMLVFDATLTNGLNTHIQFSPHASKEFPRDGSSQGGIAAWTFQPAFGPDNQMVVGLNPYTGSVQFTQEGVAYGAEQRRLHVFNDPSGPSIMPDIKFHDFYNWPLALDFDESGNLYALDANRGQVRIYKHPFADASPSAGPSPTSAPTSTPTPLPCSDARSILKNPGFDSGTNRWKFYTTREGRFSVGSKYGGCGNVARIALRIVKGNIQLYQAGIRLEPNTPYRITFLARSTKGSDMALSLHKNSSVSTNYGLANEVVDVTTQWQQHEIHFSSSGFTSTVDDARLRFFFPGYAVANEVFYVDSVVLEKN